jgi:hypothetical protein
MKKIIRMGIPLAHVRAGNEAQWGGRSFFVVGRIRGAAKERQTTQNDGLPHGTAVTQPESGG